MVRGRIAIGGRIAVGGRLRGAESREFALSNLLPSEPLQVLDNGFGTMPETILSTTSNRSQSFSIAWRIARRASAA